MKRQTRRLTASASVLLMLFAAIAPARADAPADDLKQIEYKYYFRGKYPQAIDALKTFLARVDVTGDVALRAGEFLAASHVLSGAPAAGKDVFARIIATNPEYAGPDAAIFKPEVMDVYGQARSDYASFALHAAPAVTDTLSTPAGAATPTAVETAAGKPIYKKWWFYAGAAALVGVIAGVAAGGGGGDAPPPASGSVSVGVVVH